MDAGVEGNARLTSVVGMSLLAMLAVEGYTVLDVRGMITLHIFLGIMLVGPILLKTATTMYRFVRYYQGKPAYVRKGPPHIVLRVLGPVRDLEQSGGARHWYRAARCPLSAMVVRCSLRTRPASSCGFRR